VNHFKLLGIEKRYKGKIIDLSIHQIEYPGGRRSIREIVEHPGGAVIAALAGDGRMLFIRQYRHPVEGEIVELPAGKLERGEDPLACARRELREETGYTASRWTKLTTILTTPGFCNERLHIFLAEQIAPDPAGQALEEGERSLKVLSLTIDEALHMIDTGEIVDAKTIVGVTMAQRRIAGSTHD
jgi:ADP-ribose pyrophosphatase